MLPNTLLMLLFSSDSGMLAQRLGPRIPLTIGPLVCGAGMLMMLRVGPGASYLTDVLPALLVMGAGLAERLPLPPPRGPRLRVHRPLPAVDRSRAPDRVPQRAGRGDQGLALKASSLLA
jgi:hypothetical protein